MHELAGRLKLWLGLGLPFAAGLACAGGTASDEGALLCEPGVGQMCICPNGQSSVEWCRNDGLGYLPCECEGGDEGFGESGSGMWGDGDGDPGTGDGDGEPGTGDGDGEPGTGDGDGDPTTCGDGDGDATTSGDGDGDALCEACYPGPNEDYTVCFDLVMPDPLPAGYDYPPPYQGNANYRAPICYLDLEAVDTSVEVAPNFTMGEYVQIWKGRYAVLVPEAVARVQDMRDVVGPIVVNSGYRPPDYNEMIGGATHSRHMYGDAFDLDPVDVTLNTLEGVCTDNDGFLVEYESHVHCDWRFVDVPVGFFGLPNIVPPGTFPVLRAELESDESGVLSAPATGFDEGEPMRRWSAFDGQGQLLDEARGRTYAPPAGAARVEVLVGAQIQLATELD